MLKPFLAVPALALMLFGCEPGFAEPSGPPAKGSAASFQGVVVCDTEDQVTAIVDAAKAKPDGGARAKFAALNATPDAKGEATCAFQPVIGVPIGESTDLGKFQLETDKWFHGWAVHIASPGADGWVLYLEPSIAPASLNAPTLLPNGLRLI